MMTRAQMEDAIKNLDRRLVNVEQILPTLATKDDLRQALAESKLHTDIRFESLRDDIRMVAEAVAAIPARFDELNARFDRRFARTDARLDRLEGLTQSTAKSLETLTRQLGDKGVI